MRVRFKTKKAPQVGAFFVLLCGAGAAFGLCPPTAPVETVQVERVVDGDTLRLVDGRKVRLIGLNTPELGGRGGSPEPFAEQARAMLQRLVEAERGQLSLQPGQQLRDRHGRLLAHAFDSRKRNLEAQLLAEGLGYFVAISPNVELADCLAPLEVGARTARKGLWSGGPVVPAAEVRRGGFAVLATQVVGIEHNGGGVWLATDADLVVNIPASAERWFEPGALSALVGRRIEVRGWLVERRRRDAAARWLLPVTHPSMVRPIP